MEIAEGLKQIRKMLGLSQEKMAGNVLTKSYYSKIERREFEIKACDLVAILKLHDIKPSEFFSMMEKKMKQSKYDYYIDILRKSYYRNDLNTIQRIINNLKEEKQDRKTKSLLAHAILLKTNLEGNIYQISTSQKNFIKKLIFDVDNWDKYSLRLFSMAMNLFEINEMNTIVQSILDKYKRSKDDNFSKFVPAILVNFLDYSFGSGNEDTKIIRQAIDQLKRAETIPQNCFTLIMGKYYESLWNKDYRNAQKIIDFLHQIGMNDFVAKMHKNKK
ncbi:hypothetical protein GCM10022297_13550 [Lactobacillus hamsteri]|uniref:HTH cro/C1-type domain-containing protein n=1 Tax=Lactobacillus hamsteri DSM 5661 = JCM 6256 TaxID=1423754 RepID=A0A0R1Y6K3_9LACO|nr:helix-turn-helix domain-containing protein [Lactobacillus hamsteri]KRM38048.1 hypothetical protein FC39_GL001441 [Lactobacillus hamsteri DSM 5661 = JCM 6256]